MNTEGFAKKKTCRKAASVSFWDGYAPWYRLWMEHTGYHNRIIEALTDMVKPGWKVLDIGAGNGILSLPLAAIECEVTALEPSIGMRSLLYEETFRRGIDWLEVDERRLEDIPLSKMKGYDLIMACNSLHLTEMGFSPALEKVLQARPENIFLIRETGGEGMKVKWRYDGYQPVFTTCFATESSFAYHTMDEAMEHWRFKKGRLPLPHEEEEIKAGLTYDGEHIWRNENSHVGMYWWRRNDS